MLAYVAAMPAILKDAIISAYEAAGWDIENSNNPIREWSFPCFSDCYGTGENNSE